MIDAAMVRLGSHVKSAMSAVPNVEQQFGIGQGSAYMQLVMEQLAGQGVPGAQGLLPKTPVVGGEEYAAQHGSQNVGVQQNSGRGSYLG